MLPDGPSVFIRIVKSCVMGHSRTTNGSSLNAVYFQDTEKKEAVLGAPREGLVGTWRYLWATASREPKRLPQAYSL